MSSMSQGRRRKRSEPALITNVGKSAGQYYRYRRRTYQILQWSRIPLLFLAYLFIVVWENFVLGAIVTIVSVPLPWIAVVIANAHGQRHDKRQPKVYKPGVERERRRREEELRKQLESGEPQAIERHPVIIDSEKTPPDNEDHNP